jgi:D-inositol-3-phosphate glycosyltransferase
MLTIAIVTEGHDFADDLSALCRALTDRGHTVSRHRTLDAARLTRALSRARPDVVHGHGAAASCAATTAAKLGVPAVVSVPSGTVPDAANSRLVAASTGEQRLLIESGVRRADIDVIPPGVDCDHFSPEGPASSRGRGHRLVAVGALAASSGFATAVAALPALPDTELLIASPGPDEEHVSRLRRYAGTFGVADRLTFVHALTAGKLPRVLRSADVLVSTPRHTSPDPAVLQAMACGLPVVAAETAGNRDMVVHGVTGFLVPAHRPRDLAHALRRLLRSTATREQFGAAGRDRADHRYSWQRIAVETLATYRRAGAPDPDAVAYEEFVRLRRREGHRKAAAST